ncbi:MAG: glutathione S-transferase N-terminal domain-containing protein [Patescibacteria group bacterium]|nr:glutathione S-transferase N-terminal domain-containing protein [Patescibacteria group bacterium]
MLKLYTWTTPNGYKVPIMLEELGVEFELIPVDITKGEQKKPEFLALNPNHKIPVLVDEEADGGALALFESGAILMYLGDKYGKFFSKGVRERAQEVEWLMFQMANVGPMFGQANHFLKYAPEKVEYGIKRYTDEAKRLAGVMNIRLGDAKFLGGAYSIADMATWPWVRTALDTGFLNLDDFPNLKRWYEAIEKRPAVRRALECTDKVCKTEHKPMVCVPNFDEAK